MEKTSQNIDTLNPKEFIIIKGAKANNLKSIDVAIPRNKFVVITGLSGSGKSSLAFDTLFAEGQRMYVESLSSYARQFLARMEKPEVDYIRGVSPAIAIDQKVNTRNPRSTIGTTTEIYDYLKLLFARIGKTFSPKSGKQVKKDTVSNVVDYVLSLKENTRLLIYCPLVIKDGRSLKQELQLLVQKGYTRIVVEEKVLQLEDAIEFTKDLSASTVNVLIDRIVVKEEEDQGSRIADSTQTAFFEGMGYCTISIPDGGKTTFSDKFELDTIIFEEPTVNFFSFNNPYGACRTCEGFGHVLGLDEDLVFPDKNMSIYEGAIAPWRTERMSKWLHPLLKNGIEFDFPIHRSIKDLSPEEYQVLWDGNSYFKGLNDFFADVEKNTYKIQFRVLLSRYRGRRHCPDCRGSRLRQDASYVKVNNQSIIDLVLLPIDQLHEWFLNIKLSKHEEEIADRLIKEIRNRLKYLTKVGLGYLTLNRKTATLSGGEFQRIKLATSLGSALVGSMYILDEPSIGLHSRDTHQLIEVLKTLRDLGNTVIVVEHEEEVIAAADQVIDIGPDAGRHGGELIAQGTIKEIAAQGDSHTARYMNGIETIVVPKQRRCWKDKIQIIGARENNLQNIDVEIPLGIMTAITGVSGSGKSTLIKNILYPALGKILESTNEATGKFDRLDGDYGLVGHIEFVDQNPIGKSSRSNPVTYVKAYDAIRALYSELPLSKQRGFKPAFYSFNVDGGRCDECKGEGVQRVEMQFMADLFLTCESCDGLQFKPEILDVKYKGKTIADVLNMTINESIEFFADQKSIIGRLKPLQQVGLGYIKLGQASNTLSGGEAQRVKLASFLGKGINANKEHTLFIFDEPTTGLHFHDIQKLLLALNALVEKGHTVILIEHNMEMIKSADWIIDLGPEGGDKGGTICYAGTPENLVTFNDGYTAKYLKGKL